MPNGIAAPYQDLYTQTYNAQPAVQAQTNPGLEMYTDAGGRVAYRFRGLGAGPKVVVPPQPERPGTATPPAPETPDRQTTGVRPPHIVGENIDKDMGNPPQERKMGMSTAEQISEITRRNTALNPSLKTSAQIAAGVLQGGLGLAVSEAVKMALGKESLFGAVPSFTADQMAAINTRAAELAQSGTPVQVAASSAISEARKAVGPTAGPTVGPPRTGMISQNTPTIGLGGTAPNPAAVEGPYGLEPTVGPPRTGMVSPLATDPTASLGFKTAGPVGKAPSDPKSNAARAAADRVSERSTRTTEGAARTAGGEKGPAARGTAAPGPAGSERKGGGNGGGAAGGQGSKGGSSRGSRGE